MHFHSRKCIWECRLENGEWYSQPQCVTDLYSAYTIPCHPILHVFVLYYAYIMTPSHAVTLHPMDQVHGSAFVISYYAILTISDVIVWKIYRPMVIYSYTTTNAILGISILTHCLWISNICYTLWVIFVLTLSGYYHKCLYYGKFVLMYFKCHMYVCWCIFSVIFGNKLVKPQGNSLSATAAQILSTHLI